MENFILFIFFWRHQFSVFIMIYPNTGSTPTPHWSKMEGLLIKFASLDLSVWFPMYTVTWNRKMKKESPFLKAILRFSDLKRRYRRWMISAAKRIHSPSLQLALHRVTAWRNVSSPQLDTAMLELPTWIAWAWRTQLWSYMVICIHMPFQIFQEKTFLKRTSPPGWCDKVDQGLPYFVPELCALVFKSAAMIGPTKDWFDWDHV